MINIKNVNIQLGDFELEDISFNVKQGEFYILLGPTGAGKSVILESIGGLVKLKAGKVIVNNNDVSNFKPEDRNIAICYQDYALFPHLTVKENIYYGLQFGKKNKKIDIKKDFKKLIQLLQIEHLINRYPENLSGGEKQRISLARALIIHPNILLLDEPLAALDSHIKDRLMRDIKKIQEKYKMTVIMVTHSFQEAFYLGDRVSVINEGRIVQSGTMEDILRYPNSLFVANFVGVKNVFESKLLGVSEVGFIGIRPEKVIISDKPIQADYTGIGKIKEAADMGTYFEITLETELGSIIVVMMLNEYIQSHLIDNNNIWYGFNSEDFMILKDYSTN